jgi:hypothetical protein
LIDDRFSLEIVTSIHLLTVTAVHRLGWLQLRHLLCHNHSRAGMQMCHADI